MLSIGPQSDVPSNPYMITGKAWVYLLLFACLFVRLFVCTVTDFSAEDKASSVKFCTAVHRRPRQGMSHFGELRSPEAQNRMNWRHWPQARVSG